MSVDSKTKIMSWNARSLRSDSKQMYLHQHLLHSSPHIICLQETHLEKSTKIKIPGYTWHRLDRPGGNGGGVAIGVKYGYKHRPTMTPRLKSIEATSVDVEIGDRQVRITSVYNPRYTRHFEADMTKLFHENMEHILIGDLNAKNHSWSTGDENQSGRKLFDLQAALGVIVHAPDEPTYHCASNTSSAILDILVSNSTLNFIELRTNSNLVSDHVAIQLDIDAHSKVITVQTL